MMKKKKEKLEDLIKLVKSKDSIEFNQLKKIQVSIKSKSLKKIQKVKSSDTLITLRNSDALTKLADKLSHNYIHISQRSSSRFTDDMIEHILDESVKNNNTREKFDNNNRKRNILIIGAGATYDSYPSIPLANHAIEILKKDLGFDNKIQTDEDYRENFLDAASSIYKGFTLDELKSKLDFENWLEVFSKIHSKKRVKKSIQKLYNYRYLPSLTYEIISHLFKHRFIDVIINFNFDELLEQALEEELGKENYFSIISDGDCLSMDELMTDNRLKIPIYIKPHGTVSHKSTLRFTKDSYLNVPQAIQEMINDLISGKVAVKNKNHKINNINLITIGFGLKSVEFNTILRNSITQKKDIKYEFFFFDLSKPETDRGKDDDDIINKTTSHLITINNKNSVSSRFKKLWQLVENTFKTPYKPRNLARHELMVTIFKRKLGNQYIGSRQNYYRNGSYFFDRLIVELIIELSKGKGNIDLNKLLTGRVGIYYNLYLKKSNRKCIPITEICTSKEYLDLIEIKSYTNNIFSINKKFPQENFGKEVLKSLVKCKGVNEELIKKVDKKKTKIINLLDELFLSFSSDIKPRFEDKRHFIFSSFKRENVLHTNLSLTATCYEILTSFNSWDAILVISERGKVVSSWLEHIPKLRSHIEKTKKKIFLITSDIGKIDPKIDKNILVGKEIYQLPYYAHNNHMVMFLKKNDHSIVDPRYANTRCNKFRFVRTNYFLKEGLENNINPIVFDTNNEFEKDQRLLLRIFCSYLLKSKSFRDSKNNGNPNLLHILNNQFVEKKIKGILEKIKFK